MLRYFQEDLKPSVLVELEYWDLELESFNQIVKKAIDAEPKSALWSHSSTKKIDQNYPRGNRPANFTVPTSQSNAIKDSRAEKPKAWGLKLLSAPQRSNNNELSKKAWKEKKKKRCRRDQKHWKSSTLATKVNAVQTEEFYQKKKHRALHNTS